MNPLSRIKQHLDRACPSWQARWAVYLMLGLAAVLFGGALFSLVTSCITITRPEKVETFGGFLVTGIDGGSSQAHAPSWTVGLGDLFGSLTWLLVVGGLLLLYLCWKFPSLVRRFRLRRQAKAALRGDR